MSLLEQIQLLVDPPSGDTRIVVPELSDEEGEHELRWSGSSVVWSVGGVQRRKWAFEDPNHPVSTACFAYFAINQPGSSNGSSAHSRSPATFGPFALLQDLRFETQDTRPTPVLTICAVLRDTAHLFTHDGLEFIINLPFPVESLWPLAPFGLLMRTTESSPSFYSLVRPYDELRPVLSSVDSIETLLPSHTTILHVAAAHPRSPIPAPPLIITADVIHKRIVISRYTSKDPNYTLQLAEPLSPSTAPLSPLSPLQRREHLEQRRRRSHSRTELSLTLDKMALESGSEPGLATLEIPQNLDDLLEAELTLEELWSGVLPDDE